MVGSLTPQFSGESSTGCDNCSPKLFHEAPPRRGGLAVNSSCAKEEKARLCCRPLHLPSSNSLRQAQKPPMACEYNSIPHASCNDIVLQTDTGTLRTKDLAKVLGFSSSWFTNARHIREEYNKVGPESGRTNDAIIARFQEKVANKKSSDLLSFLRAQREIIEGKAL